MQKWEYIRLVVVYSSNGFDKVVINGKDTLNDVRSHIAFHSYIQDLGKQGWEMVSMSKLDYTEVIYFKRPTQ